MKKNFHFVEETSNKHKRKIILTTFVVFVILIGGTIASWSIFSQWWTDSTYSNSFDRIIWKEVKSFSVTGLFYAGFVGGLFFVPIPQEIFFYLGLIKGNPILLSFLMINAGFLLAQLLNYYVGKNFSKVIIHLVSKKTLYGARRFVSNHGRSGVFLFNLLPLPAPLLTFGLGIVKYNIFRLFFYTLLGTFFKYLFIVAFFIVTN